MSTPAHHVCEEPVLLREDRDGIARLTLNRPGHYNALSEALLGELQSALDAIAEDRSVRVVILGANGKAFCAGHDLKEMRATPEQAYYERLFQQCSHMMLSLVRLPQPVIARVHGIATAAGCQLVATCDLAVASTDASFAVSGVNLGLFCTTPGVALARNVPRKRAFEMLVTGQFIDAETAVDYGLVNRAVAPEELDRAVAELAQAIAQKPQVAVEAGKRAFYEQIERGLAPAYDHASGVMACNMMAPETAEGVDAFIHKKKP
ncbi:MAG: enoyl-CoA hydratase [Gammaproteobacteria bacterium]|nr:enoyl-CoA hydratase [Gammaproteobacteria bacterium]